MTSATTTTPTDDKSTDLVPAPAKIPVRMGISPANLDEGWRMAKLFSESELVPKAFRGKPADVLVALELGLEVGFAPMQAIQSISVINGRPGIYGDGLLALVMASAVYRDHDEYYEVGGQRRDGLTADDLKLETTCGVCTFSRKGKPEPVTRRFTIGQAKKAQLLGKEGPWQQYPDRMLLMRARSWAARDCFPDVLRGMKSVEEIRDTPPEDDGPRPVPLQPRRLSDVKAAADPPAMALAEDPATLGGLKVLETRVVTPPQAATYYEIMTVNGVGDQVLFITHNVVLYQEAQSFAGTDHAVRITYHAEAAVREIDALTIDEASLPF